MSFLSIIVALVLIFDFINGFHDSANSIACVVSTKVLSPIAAVSMAALFRFMAFFVFHLKVASTISFGVVRPEAININVIAAATVAAIVWNLLTWWWGLPSSSSHTLVGGLIGAAITSSGLGSVIASGVIKIVSFIFIAPLLGFILSYTLSTSIMWIFRKLSPATIDKWFRRLQLISASSFSLGHGGNDAQKSMGLIWAAMLITGTLSPDAELPPMWVILSCYTALALGTLFGGWRIVKTMGQKITKLKPFEGFCAETAGSIALVTATHWGIPVSTTHTITGAIIGVGARKGVTAVKWGVTRKIYWAWILTIPLSGIIGGIMYLLFNYIN
ncbi:MAG TPA: inorganic phosphate transporter [Bacteroidales bacterium]|jgi:PiT family inorganic phosphate transporter|nr:inorganic phosphate transporter [Bacteroidales bacterium]HQH23447.1 inorganic phosphate transporter [Bacteroidales bacterium]HQJ82023.1 inorganic phosphate transporter [Bacteroidales bacterium]